MKLKIMTSPRSPFHTEDPLASLLEGRLCLADENGVCLPAQFETSLESTYDGAPVFIAKFYVGTGEIQFVPGEKATRSGITAIEDSSQPPTAVASPYPRCEHCGFNHRPLQKQPAPGVCCVCGERPGNLPYGWCDQCTREELEGPPDAL